MAISFENDCTDVFGKFKNEVKFADASKNFLKSQNNCYKLTKQTVEYGFAITEVSNVIPLKFSPLFKVIKCIVKIFFELWSICYKIGKIQQTREDVFLAKRKIEKWNVPSLIDDPINKSNTLALKKLKVKYDNKLRKLEQNGEEDKLDKFRKVDWEENIQLIETVIKTKDPQSLKQLQEKFEARKTKKIIKWENEKVKFERELKKNSLGIAIAVGTISLEVIAIVALTFSSTIFGDFAFTAIQIGSNLVVSGLKYGKYLWWNMSINEKPRVIGIKSVEHIATALVKTKVVPFTEIIHPSLIKGACKSTLSTFEIFDSHNYFIDNNQAIALCRREVAKLDMKRTKLLKISNKIASGNRQELIRQHNRYTLYIKTAEDNIGKFSPELKRADEDRKAELRATISDWNGQIVEYRIKLNALSMALKMHALKYAKIAAKSLIEPLNREISDWKLSEQLNKKKNLKEGMKTALSIVEIARFIFLVISVSLALVGVGVNLLPFLFVSSIFANILYIGYFLFNRKTNQEINSIIDIWTRNEVVETCAS